MLVNSTLEDRELGPWTSYHVSLLGATTGVDQDHARAGVRTSILKLRTGCDGREGTDEFLLEKSGLLGRRSGFFLSKCSLFRSRDRLGDGYGGH